MLLHSLGWPHPLLVPQSTVCYLRTRLDSLPRSPSGLPVMDCPKPGATLTLISAAVGCSLPSDVKIDQYVLGSVLALAQAAVY